VNSERNDQTPEGYLWRVGKVGEHMTTELKRAMVKYEQARIRYRTAVLASLNGASNGDAIRESIQAFQRASAELKRLSPQPEPVAVPREAPEAENESSFPGWALVRRLLKAS
jgi:hypothetical protein